MPDVPPEAWNAALHASRGYAPDLAEALVAYMATGADGRDIAEIAGAAIARAAHDAVEAAAPHIRAAAIKEERERWCRIEPDPEQPGYNRGVFDISGFAAEVVAGERDAIRAQVYAEIRQLAYEKDAHVVKWDPEFPFSPPEIMEPFWDLVPGGETDG